MLQELVMTTIHCTCLMNIQKTTFCRRIAHGLICENLIETKLPEPRVIFITLNLVFVKPVFIGETITAKAVIKEIIRDKKILCIETICYNQGNQTVVSS